MKFLTLISLPILVFMTIVHPAIAVNSDNKSQQKLIVIDKEKSYPKKKLELKSEVSYIRLETRKDMLVGQDGHIYHISNNKILIANTIRGDVLIFDIKGKALSHFNQKGGNGYVFLNYAVLDEPNHEVFIADRLSKKICVFSEEGILKRTLRLPPTTDIIEINNFDNNSLLAFNEHQYGPVKEKQPYMFISKKDGKILSKLNITTNKATAKVLDTGKGLLEIGNNCMGNSKFGDEYILSNMSCDTIYLLKQDKTLTPLLVQRPSVFSEHPVITSIGMKTDDFIIYCQYPYDLNAAKKRTESGKKQSPDGGIKSFIYEYKTGQFSELYNRMFWSEKVDIPKNMHVELLDCYLLKDWLQKGYLKGEMKKIATKVDLSDNPVIVISKLK